MVDQTYATVSQYLQNLLREDFESPDPEVRKKAIFALGRLARGPEVLDQLRRLSTVDPSPEVRYTAKKALNYWVETMGEAGPAAPTRVDLDGLDKLLDPEKLRAVLESGQGVEQLMAIMEVVQRGEEVALPVLEERLVREDDPWVLSMIVKAVGALGDGRHVKVLQPFIRHPNPRVVANAVEALDMLGDEMVVQLVKPLLSSEDNRVRANAIKTIHRYDPDLALANLREMARSKREWMRDSAIYCLKVLDNPGCEVLLDEMLEGEPARELQDRILEVLALKGGEATAGAVRLLADRARPDERERLEAFLSSLCTRLELDGDAVRALAAARTQAKAEERASPAAVSSTAHAVPLVAHRPGAWRRAADLLRRLSFAGPAVLGVALLAYAGLSLLDQHRRPVVVDEGLALLRRYAESPDPARFHGAPTRLLGRVVALPAPDRLRLQYEEFVLDVTFPGPQPRGDDLRPGVWVAVQGALRGRGITGDVFVTGTSLTICDPPQVQP